MINGELDKSIAKYQNAVDGVFDHLEGNWGVILTIGNQKLLWPAARIPENIKPGATVKIILAVNGEETGEREKIAKKILNEILHHD